MQTFTRRSARVEAMRLASDRALDVASEWLAAHGISSRQGFGALWLHVPDAPVMPARLGQWLAYNPNSGEFTVWDEGHFQAAHSEAAK